MKIAFDLDDTLIPTTRSFSVGSQTLPMPFGIFYTEALRTGAVTLLKKLSVEHDIVIYTTSLRNPFYVTTWFKLWGISICQVINQDVHVKHTTGTRYARFSKSPKCFDIDVLIDDNEGVKIECDAQSSAVIIISPDDHNWVLTITHELERLSS